MCPRCLDQACPFDDRHIAQVEVDGTLLYVEASFCYLGDMLCAGGGCAPRGGTLIFSYIRRLGPFFWGQIFEFQYFLGFSEK